jgi:hypothetical protein
VGFSNGDKGKIQSATSEMRNTVHFDLQLKSGITEIETQ